MRNVELFVSGCVIGGMCMAALGVFARAWRQGYERGFADGLDGTSIVNEQRGRD